MFLSKYLKIKIHLLFYFMEKFQAIFYTFFSFIHFIFLFWLYSWMYIGMSQYILHVSWLVFYILHIFTSFYVVQEDFLSFYLHPFCYQALYQVKIFVAIGKIFHFQNLLFFILIYSYLICMSFKY